MYCHRIQLCVQNKGPHFITHVCEIVRRRRRRRLRVVGIHPGLDQPSSTLLLHLKARFWCIRTFIRENVATAPQLTSFRRRTYGCKYVFCRVCHTLLPGNKLLHIGAVAMECVDMQESGGWYHFRTHTHRMVHARLGNAIIHAYFHLVGCHVLIYFSYCTHHSVQMLVERCWR